MAIFSGKKLRAIRKYQDLTAAELAERADICTSIIYSYESGKITPRMQTTEKIAAALGVPVVELLTDEARGSVNGGCGGNGQRGSHEGADGYQVIVREDAEAGAAGDSFAGSEMGNSGGVHADKRDRAQTACTFRGGRDGSEQGYRRQGQSLQMGITAEEQEEIKAALMAAVRQLAQNAAEGNAPMTAACIEAARVLRTCF